jgi:uncharacterized membrane protein
LFISAYERRFRVRADKGVPLSQIEGWPALLARFERATTKGDGAEFLRALADLGPLLAQPMPRAHDDVNELADGVTEAA